MSHPNPPAFRSFAHAKQVAEAKKARSQSGLRVTPPVYIPVKAPLPEGANVSIRNLYDALTWGDGWQAYAEALEIDAKARVERLTDEIFRLQTLLTIAEAERDLALFPQAMDGNDKPHDAQAGDARVHAPEAPDSQAYPEAPVHDSRIQARAA